jgi:hypothetical protein
MTDGDPLPWQPERLYLKGEIVADLATHYGHAEQHGPFEHDQPPGYFRCLHDLRSGLLNPRYAAIDRDDMWERVDALGDPT